MSRTHKTQRAYLAYHTDISNVPIGTTRGRLFNEIFRNIGQRYGDQRKMRAKLKISKRRIERRKNNKIIDLDLKQV